MKNKKVDMTGQKLKYKNIIIAVSLLIPIVVAILFRVKIDVTYSFDFLPKIYATINGVTTIFLILAYLAIRSKKINLHRKLMKSSILQNSINENIDSQYFIKYFDDFRSFLINNTFNSFTKDIIELKN